MHLAGTGAGRGAISFIQNIVEERPKARTIVCTQPSLHALRHEEAFTRRRYLRSAKLNAVMDENTTASTEEIRGVFGSDKAGSGSFMARPLPPRFASVPTAPSPLVKGDALELNNEIIGITSAMCREGVMAANKAEKTTSAQKKSRNGFRARHNARLEFISPPPMLSGGALRTSSPVQRVTRELQQAAVRFPRPGPGGLRLPPRLISIMLRSETGVSLHCGVSRRKLWSMSLDP